MRPPLGRLVLALWLAAPGAASGLETDAASLARGGIWGLGRIEASPGHADSSRRGWAFDVGTPYVGTDLAAGGVSVHQRLRPVRLAFALRQLRTPVGTETAAALALQAQRGAVAIGAAGWMRALSWPEQPVSWDVAPRFGMGWGGRDTEVTGVLVLGGADWAAARLALAGSVVVSERLAVLLQVEPASSSPGDVRLGLEWRAPRWRWRAGWDVATAAYSLGFGWQGTGQSFAWGARTHPELGWSHAWTYARP